MFINHYCEVWRAAAQDDARPTLEHVLIVDSTQADKWNIGLEPGYNGLALATDGYMLAIVPVQLEDGDEPGLVDAELIKLAQKVTPKTMAGAWLKLGQKRVRLVDQTDHPRYKGGDWPGNWPDITCILPAKRPDGRAEEDGKPDPGLARHPVLSINTAYLIDLTRAMGARYIKSTRDEVHYRLLYLTPTYGTPIIVEVAKVGALSDSWRAPLGILMPIEDDDAQDNYYEGGRPRTLGAWNGK